MFRGHSSARSFSVQSPQFRLQYMSDLHLERHKEFPRVKPMAPNLALLGDIGHPHMQNYRDFLSYCSNSYERTFLLTGNHEYYGSSTPHVHDVIDQLCDKLGNVSFLQQRTTDSDGVTIAGCTLWSNISQDTVPALNDFRYISTMNGLLTHEEYLNMHRRDVTWLRSVIMDIKKPLIILTHHLPSYRVIGERYVKYKRQDAFASHLDSMIKGPHLRAWLCGHSHDNIDRIINDVYCGINSGQYIDFRKTLEI